ncbi:MAG: ribosome silencing factor [Oscillatoriaceae bacterium SKW80]|nr:ribosome silencing factor [Oscillatoriaceae bacterium SKYG93]MCX8120846.1 ribosome silencing factor [Oscillatoriaceae bacterium SKW80]MDW8454187.1 ribosome silencing factor [Oscillatoriaceae cyanobacterium SKYGB_i_bin93]HIK26488.1 ribosome silencing factor [Oscillatoriaceae cyanobacterium M7585_C2015_266]
MTEYTKLDLVTEKESLKPATSYQLAITIAKAADARKGGDIIILEVAEVSYLADYFVIVTGFSRVQVRAISQSIQEKAEQECNRLPRQIEGQAEGTWVLMDYGDVIVHILMPKEREYYNLEAFWGHARRINFSADTQIGRG